MSDEFDDATHHPEPTELPTIESLTLPPLAIDTPPPGATLDEPVDAPGQQPRPPATRKQKWRRALAVVTLLLAGGLLAGAFAYRSSARDDRTAAHAQLQASRARSDREAKRRDEQTTATKTAKNAAALAKSGLRFEWSKGRTLVSKARKAATLGAKVLESAKNEAAFASNQEQDLLNDRVAAYNASIDAYNNLYGRADSEYDKNIRSLLSQLFLL